MEGTASNDMQVKTPPSGLALFLMVGPGIVWAAGYIGSGEVILATRTGAILGSAVLWMVVVVIFLKFWIGISGGHYTVCTGEGMVDMFDRIPGPRHWVVWIVLVAQFIGATFSIGALATVAGAFVNAVIPIGPTLSGWLVAVFSLAVVWSGVYEVLQIVMAIFAFIVVLGVMYVSVHVFPGLSEFLRSLTFQVPDVPQWALATKGVNLNPWKELLPLAGWGAGGFAAQVWYTYWVLGAGYGAAAGRGYGKAADVSMLKSMTRDTAEKIKGWCRVLYTDASFATIIGIVVTSAFLIAGAGVLQPAQIAPQGQQVAFELSRLFSLRWGAVGGFLFLLAGAAALVATQISQLAGWPRLLADSFRICFPGFEKRFAWKSQFRLFLLFFLCSNMILVFYFKKQPVALVQFSAILDGLLLTPLQAIWVAIGLFWVLPRLLSKDAAEILRPNFFFAVALLITALVFGYFCMFQAPSAVMSLIGAK